MWISTYCVSCKRGASFGSLFGINVNFAILLFGWWSAVITTFLDPAIVHRVVEFLICDCKILFLFGRHNSLPVSFQLFGLTWNRMLQLLVTTLGNHMSRCKQGHSRVILVIIEGLAHCIICNSLFATIRPANRVVSNLLIR